MSGMSMDHAVHMIEQQLGIFRTARANGTRRVADVEASIKAMQASLDARLTENDRLANDLSHWRSRTLRLLDEAERVVLSDSGSKYVRLLEAVNEVRGLLGLGNLKL